jgi:hypothetical protein
LKTKDLFNVPERVGEEIHIAITSSRGFLPELNLLGLAEI